MREYFSQKFTKLVGCAKDEDIFQMVWATNALQSGRSDRATEYIRFPGEAIVENITSRYFVPEWTLETLLNENLTIPKYENQKNGIIRIYNCSNFSAICTLVNLMRKIENYDDRRTLKKVNVLRELHRLAQRQFEWQRGFSSHINYYRSSYIYGGPASRTYFSSKYEFSLDEFTLGCFALRSLWQQFPWISRIPNLTSIGLSILKSEKIVDTLSIRHSQARALATRLRKGNEHFSYKPSLLRQYPCVSFGRMASG